jgi:hypothetical protein
MSNLNTKLMQALVEKQSGMCQEVLGTCIDPDNS